MSFRNNLQHLRSTQNMTQEQLAMLLGVSRQSVTKWEAEKSYPEMDKLLKICDIFGCSLDDLVSGDLTGREPEPSRTMPAGPATDVCGYDEHMRHRANFMGAGVGVLILGVAAMASLEVVLGESLPAVCLFVAVAVGLALIIPTALEHSMWRQQHPYIEDFYTADDRVLAQRSFALWLVVGITVILAGLSATIALEGVVHDDIAGGIFLAFVAVGVGILVRAGLMKSRLNLAEYNRDNADELPESSVEHEELLEGRRARLRTASVCGAIMLVATIVGIVLLFALGPNKRENFFFLAWPIGGLLCGVYSCVSWLIPRD